MTWLWRSPEPGDWVATTVPIRLGIADLLLGGDAGVPVGTRGVVVAALGWDRYEVRLDGGLFGASRIWARGRDLRVVRRGGGAEAFGLRARRLASARLGVALALVGPLILFAASWFARGGSSDGLVAALAESAIFGAFDVLAFAVSNPVDAALYCITLGAAARVAFRR